MQRLGWTASYLTLCLALFMGCAGSSSQVKGGAALTTSPPGKVLPSSDPDGPSLPPPGSDREHPLQRCGPSDSYAAIREFRCEDGSAPLLQSPPGAAQAARKGNVGRNTEGHIVDRYLVPCSPVPTSVFVDMYSCPEEQSMMLLARGFGGDPEPVKEAFSRLASGLSLLRAGKRKEAAAVLTQVRTDLERLEGAGKPGQADRRAQNLIPEAIWALAQVHMADGQIKEAEKLLLEAETILEGLGGPYERRLITCLSTHARLYFPEKPQAAVPLLLRAVRIAEHRSGLLHPDVADALTDLAKLYDFLGDKAKAQATRARIRSTPSSPAQDL